jgi:hypothetical protein
VGEEKRWSSARAEAADERSVYPIAIFNFLIVTPQAHCNIDFDLQKFFFIRLTPRQADHTHQAARCPSTPGSRHGGAPFASLPGTIMSDRHYFGITSPYSLSLVCVCVLLVHASSFSSKRRMRSHATSTCSESRTIAASSLVTLNVVWPNSVTSFN